MLPMMSSVPSTSDPSGSMSVVASSTGAPTSGSVMVTVAAHAAATWIHDGIGRSQR